MHWPHKYGDIFERRGLKQFKFPLLVPQCTYEGCWFAKYDVCKLIETGSIALDLACETCSSRRISSYDLPDSFCFGFGHSAAKNLENLQQVYRGSVLSRSGFSVIRDVFRRKRVDQRWTTKRKAFIFKTDVNIYIIRDFTSSHHRLLLRMIGKELSLNHITVQ